MTRSRGKRSVFAGGTFVLVAVALVPWLARDHIRFWWRFESLGRNDQGYPEYRHRRTGIVMVKVPGGTFLMGSPNAPADITGVKQEASHEVRLNPFLIAKFETTQAAWQRVMKRHPARNKGDKFPVTDVSWDDCQEFCGKTDLCLPTEAQWEYACRAGTVTPFAFAKRLTGRDANHNRTAGSPTAVGSFAPNAFGLYDMHGNVSEVCQDAFDEYFYSHPEATETDPFCEVDTFQNQRKVVRGGSWWSSPYECRSAARAPVDRDMRSIDYDDLGFRPAYYPLP